MSLEKLLWPPCKPLASRVHRRRETLWRAGDKIVIAVTDTVPVIGLLKLNRWLRQVLTAALSTPLGCS